jgi:hypothetical protein
MGHKNRNAQPQTQVQIGRRVATLPTTVPTPGEKLRAHVERNAKAAEELRKLQAENAQLERQLQRERIDRNIEDIGILKVQAGELSKVDALKLGRVLKAKFERHCASGREPRKFDPYDVMNRFMARIGKALPVAPKNANPLDAHLPPPTQAGHVLPADAASRDAAMRASQERGARLREQVLQDREAYNAALRRYGLDNPAFPSVPGNARGGLGQ